MLLNKPNVLLQVSALRLFEFLDRATVGKARTDEEVCAAEQFVS